MLCRRARVQMPPIGDPRGPATPVNSIIYAAETHFDTTGYLAANPDVAAAGINPLDHYLTLGTYEGRTVVNDGLWG